MRFHSYHIITTLPPIEFHRVNGKEGHAYKKMDGSPNAQAIAHPLSEILHGSSTGYTNHQEDQCMQICRDLLSCTSTDLHPLMKESTFTASPRTNTKMVDLTKKPKIALRQ